MFWVGVGGRNGNKLESRSLSDLSLKKTNKTKQKEPLQLSSSLASTNISLSRMGSHNYSFSQGRIVRETLCFLAFSMLNLNLSFQHLQDYKLGASESIWITAVSSVVGKGKKTWIINAFGELTCLVCHNLLVTQYLISKFRVKVLTFSMRDRI